jgi:hypothetical protein
VVGLAASWSAVRAMDTSLEAGRELRSQQERRTGPAVTTGYLPLAVPGSRQRSS